MIRGLAALLVLVLVPLLPPPAARAAERITLFHAEITVRPDSVIEVRETIEVTVEGVEIRRGILRDLPLSRTAPDGASWRTPYRILSVTQDGAPARWRTEQPGGDLLRIRIGDPEVLLPHGTHRYVIAYESGAQVRPFPEHDELWWNVTGEHWTFPILRAEAVVRLPGGAGATWLRAWTGPRGTREDMAATSGLGTATPSFASLRPLGRGEGFTVALGWPKGHVAFAAAPPGLREPRTAIEWVGGAGNVALLLGALAVVLGYVGGMWWRIGRDPAGRAVVPRFAPPAGLSPGACRYLVRMEADTVALSATLIGLAAKGVVGIGDTRPPTLWRIAPSGAPPTLDDAEATLLERLPFEPMPLAQTERKRAGPLHAARQAFELALRRSHLGPSFALNRLPFAGGIALVALLGLLMGMQADLTAPPPPAIEDVLLYDELLTGLTFLGGIPLILIGGAMARRTGTWWRGLGWLLALAGAAGWSVFALAFALAAFGGFGLLWWLFLLASAAALLLAWRILPARTPRGQRLYEEVEGFRRFLALTETDRLRDLEPPAMTRQMFRDFLPYALALDVLNAWTARFAAAVAAGAVPALPEGGDHGIDWGDGEDAGGLTDRVAAMTEDIGGAVGAAAAPAASDSSGSGSGSSGGGGGGGGGGGSGW